MLGKNNKYKFQKLSQDQTIKHKMKKKGKQWITSTLTVTALGFGFFSFTNMTTHADQTTVQQANGGNTAPSNQASEVHTNAASQETVSPDVHHDETTHEQPQASAPTNQDKVTSTDASQSDQDKEKTQVDAKADNTTKQDDGKVTPSNVITDQQANGQDASHHDQVTTNDNANQSKQAQPVAKKWGEQKVQPKEETPQKQANKDDKVAPKLDTMKINGVDKVNVAVQNPQGQVITHLPLNQDQLPQGYDGKAPLTFEQVKAATGTVKSTKGQRDNVIPAPDKDGNYNWNSDQFNAAKAQNAVHSGSWGTAQWFMDKDNNLFVSNGELTNNTNTNSGLAKYDNNYSNYQDYIGDVYYNPSSDFNTFSSISNGKTLDEITNHAVSSNDIREKVFVQYGDMLKVEIYAIHHTSYASKDEYNTQGLATSIIKELGNKKVNLNSVNFTSSVKLPKNASNIFKADLSTNKSETYDNGIVGYKLISKGSDALGYPDNANLGTYTDYNHQKSDPNNYTQVNSTNNMTIGKITGYSNMDTSQTTNMNNLFGGQAVDPDISSWDTSNTTNMANMMSGTQESHLDLSHNDLSKVTDFSNMANTPTLRTANLNNDTIQNSSNKANMLNGNVQEVSFNKKGAA